MSAPERWRAVRERLRAASPGLAVLLAALAAAVLLFPGVARGREHLWGDFVTWYYPSHEYAADRLRHGGWPLWNPYTDAGMPFAGEADHGTFYPPSWLLHLLAPDRARLYGGLEWFVLLHIAAAVLTLYGLLRALGCGRAAALAGGLAYGLSGSFSARAAQVSLACAQAWVPAALGGLVIAVRHGSLRALAVSALALGLIGLSGSPATLVVTLMGLGIVCLAAVLAGDGRPLATRATRGLGALALVLAAGALVAAVQLLPMKEFVDLSERSAYDYGQVSDYAVSPASLVMLVVPRFFGWLEYDVPSYWGPNNYVELSGYAGILTLALAALACRFRPWRETAPWLVLSVVALWIALGAHGGLHYLVYRTVPVLGQMRAPGRYLLLWALGAAVLAGLGLDAVLRGAAPEPRRRWLAGLAAATATLGIVLALARPALALVLAPWQLPFFSRGILLAVLAASGATVGLALLYRSRARPVVAAVAVILAADLAFQGRGIGVVPESDAVRELRAPSGGYELELAREPSLFRIRNRFEGPGDLMLARLQSDFGPGRHVLEYQDFDERILSHDSPLLDLLNVRYLGEMRNPLVQAATPSLVARPYAWVRPGADVVIVVDPPLESEVLEVVTTTFGGAGLTAGQTIGAIDLEADGAPSTSLPLRVGVETADAVQSGGTTGAREIAVTYHVDVSDAASLRRHHYLARLTFPRRRVERVRLRAVGADVGLAVKELYVPPAAGSASAWRLVHEQPMRPEAVLRVYENTNVMPRALLVPRARVAASRAEALALVAGPGFDPRSEVVIEGGAATTPGAAPADPSAARVERYEPERIQVAADVAAGGAWLLLSEVHFPGWSATVDGREAAILRADALFRAIRLEGGHHDVVVRYAPRSFRRGLGLSLLGGVLLAGLVAAGLSPGRARAAPSGAASAAAR